MQFVIIGVLILASMAGMAGAYKTGETHGITATDAKWQKSIADANKKAEAALAEANDKIKAKDDELSRALASKEEELKEHANALEKARQQTPLSDSCNACRIPRVRIERVRSVVGGEGASRPYQAGASGAGAVNTSGAQGASHLPAK